MQALFVSSTLDTRYSQANSYTHQAMMSVTNRPTLRPWQRLMFSTKPMLRQYYVMWRLATKRKLE